MSSLLAVVLTSALSSSLVLAASPQSYTFISGDDLYDALAQESMVLQGYTLGVVDGLKHSTDPQNCFVIPLRPDADQVIYASFLDYWAEKNPRPTSSVEAITEMMRAHYPCDSK